MPSSRDPASKPPRKRGAKSFASASAKLWRWFALCGWCWRRVMELSLANRPPHSPNGSWRILPMRSYPSDESDPAREKSANPSAVGPGSQKTPTKSEKSNTKFYMLMPNSRTALGLGHASRFLWRNHHDCYSLLQVAVPARLRSPNTSWIRIAPLRRRKSPDQRAEMF